MSVDWTTTDLPAPATERVPAGLPRLLAGVPPRGALSLERHTAIYGSLPAKRGRGRRRARERATLLLDEIERSGLLGHGGAAFPTATKIRAVARSRGPSIVVVNATEGEPASSKDETLLEALPHLLIDGSIVAAEAAGANEVILCVCESATTGMESLVRAVEERAFGRRAEHAPTLRIEPVPANYVTGQESALVNYLNGGAAMPTFTPPMPFERGVRRRPTLVNNAETIAHLALIARHGASWFRELGTPSQPGSALVTLSGPVANPGVYEIEHSAPLPSLIEAAGGMTARAQAALIGGYAGSWVAGELLNDLALSNEHLARYGASLGAGVVLLLSDDACPVAETARLARWLARESAGQCGPCVHGLGALAEAVSAIAGGSAHASATRRIEQLASLTARRGACAHPDGAVNVILSAFEVFAPDFTEHARHGPCDACAQPAELPMPRGAVRSETSRRARR
jgi:NADH:ubiquinone oxidoreductase subunit F (NADH-binding)